MKDSIFLNPEFETPCYVYDLAAIEEVLTRIREACDTADCQFLYSVKSASNAALLRFIAPYVDGFSCSSLFELKLAREFVSANQVLHVTTPGYRPGEFAHTAEQADYLSFNSLSQYRRLSHLDNQQTSLGLRINPELSLVKDKRYDPCRADSRLGVKATELEDAIHKSEFDWQHISGISIHNNCESSDLNELLLSVKRLLAILGKHEVKPDWFNLGGGYLWQKDSDSELLHKVCATIRQHYDARIFIEPGKAVTGRTGYLLASVIDIIEASDLPIAVLDTTINHLPEVFEYQYQPDIANASIDGDNQYQLAGSSCLSGDLFGDYRFDTPLKIGSRVLFSNVGAYMQVKANCFNGINLPSTYLLDAGKKPELVCTHDYAAYRSRL